MSEPIRLAGLSPSAFMTRGERSADDAQARSFFDSALEQQPGNKREDKGRLQPPGQPSWSWGRLAGDATTPPTPKPETSLLPEGLTDERADNDVHALEYKSNTYDPTDPNPRNAHSAKTVPESDAMQTLPATTLATDDEPTEPEIIPAMPDKDRTEQKDVVDNSIATAPHLHFVADDSPSDQTVPARSDPTGVARDTENGAARHLADTANRPTSASPMPLQGEATRRAVQPPHRNSPGSERLVSEGREATIAKEDGENNGRIRSILQVRSPRDLLNPHKQSDNLAGQVTMLSKQATPAMAPGPTPLQLPTGGPAAQIVSAMREDGELAARLSTSANQVQEAPASRPRPLHTIQIQLNPAELGRVTARLSISGTQLNVDLRVETSQARAQLTNDSDSIVKALKASGFEVDRVTVQLSPPSSNVGSSSMQDRGGGTLSANGGEADQAGEDSHRRNAEGHGSRQERNGNEGTHQETTRGGLYI